MRERIGVAARRIGLVVLVIVVAGCASAGAPPVFAMKGQAAAQREADARDCTHQVESAARAIGVASFTGWSEAERYTYLACMEGRGYAAAN